MVDPTAKKYWDEITNAGLRTLEVSEDMILNRKQQNSMVKVADKK